MVGENIAFVKSPPSDQIAALMALGYNQSRDVSQKEESTMRVIAGEAKGKSLKPVPGTGTRPITDRVKESLFNILRWSIPDCRFLDLFAGTGSVGIEALSQGASEAVFVEKAAKAVKIVKENLSTTQMSHRAKVIHDDVFRFVRRAHEPFDIIYVAPPQYQKLWSKTLLALDEGSLLSAGGTIIVQIFPKEFEPIPLKQYAITDQRKYGSTMLCFYQYNTSTDSAASG